MSKESRSSQKVCKRQAVTSFALGIFIKRNFISVVSLLQWALIAGSRHILPRLVHDSRFRAEWKPWSVEQKSLLPGERKPQDFDSSAISHRRVGRPTSPEVLPHGWSLQ